MSSSWPEVALYGRTAVTLLAMRNPHFLIALLLTPVLDGCGRNPHPPTASDVSSSSTLVLTDHWLGQWNGPEGTFLLLTGGGGKYQIIIQNLDGPRQFSGRAVGDQIQFERDGVSQSIRATDGAATGMKWLLDKQQCLTIQAGEGYCRD